MIATDFLKRHTRKDTVVLEVEPPSVPGTAEEVAAQVRSRGATPYVIDGSELVNKRMVLDAISAELSFPEWAGRNLDALYDCLTDLSWLPEGEHVLIWAGYQTLAECDPKAYRGITSVLRDAEGSAYFGRPFSALRTRE